MGIQNVCEKGAEQAAAAAKPPVIESWAGFSFVNGKVQDRAMVSYGQSTLAQAQEGYNATHPKPGPKKAEPKTEDEGYGWTTPFTWVGNVFSTIFGFFSDMIKGIFGICFDYEKKADVAPDKKDGTPEAGKKKGTPEAGKKEGTPEAGKKEGTPEAKDK